MPELPEVETIVRELKPVITGKTVAAVSILWQPTVEGDLTHFSQVLTGNKITRIQRRGKYLCFFLSNGPCMTIHLRMTGKLVFEPDNRDQNYIRVAFGFADGSGLYFVDIRKFGRIKLWSPSEPLLPRLGPEPLEEKTVLEALRGRESKRAIKTFLLDQGVLAGVGNIYADEALFLAGIHPLTPAFRVSQPKMKKLSRHIPVILKKAIENNGTTISDYRRTDKMEGRNQFFLKVYGRAGQPCPTCGRTIKRIGVNNRSSHFCPRCQRKRNP
ncbi:MAG: DNA-formamidopyrimidine glycosylase [bacterium]|nr:DNA-formamidopyrimidine glycosylase [bacterium]